MESVNATLFVNGQRIDGFTSINWTDREPMRIAAGNFSATGTFAISRSGYQRIYDLIAHAANLRNPRWLKRRARMRRKKRRGWA